MFFHQSGLGRFPTIGYNLRCMNKFFKAVAKGRPSQSRLASLFTLTICISQEQGTAVKRKGAHVIVFSVEVADYFWKPCYSPSEVNRISLFVHKLLFCLCFPPFLHMCCLVCKVNVPAKYHLILTRWFPHCSFVFNALEKNRLINHFCIVRANYTLCCSKSTHDTVLNIIHNMQ